MDAPTPKSIKIPPVYTLESTAKQIPQMEKSLEPKDNKAPLAAKSLDGEELYVVNFEPYQYESLSPALKGKKALTDYDQFIHFYVNKDYVKSNLAFEKLSKSLQENDNVRFIEANALMAFGKTAEAETILASVIENEKSRYVDESKWYLGLCYLKLNQISKAKEQMQMVEMNARSKKNKEAIIILKKL